MSVRVRATRPAAEALPGRGRGLGRASFGGRGPGARGGASRGRRAGADPERRPAWGALVAPLRCPPPPRGANGVSAGPSPQIWGCLGGRGGSLSAGLPDSAPNPQTKQKPKKHMRNEYVLIHHV